MGLDPMVLCISGKLFTNSATAQLACSLVLSFVSFSLPHSFSFLLSFSLESSSKTVVFNLPKAATL